MADVTYYVALPFNIRGRRRCSQVKLPMSKRQRSDTQGGAIITHRRKCGRGRVQSYRGSGRGEFSDAVVLKAFGDVPYDLSTL